MYSGRPANAKCSGLKWAHLQSGPLITWGTTAAASWQKHCFLDRKIRNCGVEKQMTPAGRMANVLCWARRTVKQSDLFFFPSSSFCIKQLVALQLAALEKKTSFCFSVYSFIGLLCVCVSALLTLWWQKSLDTVLMWPLAFLIGVNFAQHVNQSGWMAKTSDLNWLLRLWHLIMEGTSAIHCKKDVCRELCVQCRAKCQENSDFKLRAHKKSNFVIWQKNLLFNPPQCIIHFWNDVDCFLSCQLVFTK